MLQERDQVLPLREYLLSVPNSVILFVLRDFAGDVLSLQTIPFEELSIRSSTELGAKFVVDELLTSKMIPGMYRLFAYLAYPKAGIEEPESVEDYVLDICLTEQGIKIKVNGEISNPSVGI